MRPPGEPEELPELKAKANAASNAVVRLAPVPASAERLKGLGAKAHDERVDHWLLVSMFRGKGAQGITPTAPPRFHTWDPAKPVQLYEVSPKVHRGTGGPKGTAASLPDGTASRNGTNSA